MSLKTRLLFVDKDKDSQHLFYENLHDENLLIQTASNGREALERIKNFPVDIVMLCIGQDGLIHLDEIHACEPSNFIVAVADSAAEQERAKAMQLGAYDYLLKPLDFDAVRALIKKINNHRKVLEKSSFVEHERRKKHRFENFIGRDPKMLEIYNKIDDIAATDATVLITGESGTGKELVAEAIHYRSSRRASPLIRVNCAAFTETLINSELFGHEKGAFSGAAAMKKGCFELADKGTIFLDEIGDIPLLTQIALLRVLDSGSFQRVGGGKTLKVNTRIICATNKDLWHEVKEKRFREDLFYRIDVVPIHMPPLRERKSDIPLLSTHFLKRYAVQTGKNITRISGPAMETLRQYDWPGNVREFANIIEQAVVFCKKMEIAPDNLPRKMHGAPSSKSFALALTSSSLPEAESTLIRKVLNETDWNIKQTARDLNIARGTLYSKIKKYGIEKPHSGD